MAPQRKLILQHIDQPGYTPDIECYLRHGGYQTWQRVLSLQPKFTPDGKALTPQEQIPDGPQKPVEISVLDLPYDFTTLAQAGTMSGSRGVIVLDESVDMVWALWNICEFFAHESCGQCTPCREGVGWIVQILRRMVQGLGRPEDVEELLRLSRQIMGGKTVCAVGDACVWPVESFLTKFREEFVAACRPKSRSALAVTGPKAG